MSKTVDLRSQMPQTAEWINQRRAEWGKEHVNTMLRQALAGEPGKFYAIEAGHVLGVPFPSTHGLAQWQEYAVLTGVGFAAFMEKPNPGGA